MLTIEEIQRFIDEDRTSEKKMFARKGQAYYDGDHDIKLYRLFYYNADGELVEDKTRSNVKIPHPFFTELVDQAVQYVLSGKDGFVKSNNAELQAELDSYFNQNEDFVAELSEVLTGCMSKGFEYMYAYKNAENRISFMCADSIGVIEVRAKDTDDNTEYVIYWYVDRIEKGHKKIKRIQVWDKDQTYYFVQTDEGKIVEDDSEKLNPKPHTLYKKMNDNNTYYENFGFIPFFRLDNNKKQFSCLKTVKELIDDYDLMASSLSNNLIDFDTPIHVVKGFEGDSLDELQQNLKTKKIIGMESTDTGAGVDIKTVDVPFQARQVKLELDAYYEKVLDHYKTMVDGAIERFAEYYASDELEISLDTEKMYDIGDIVGAFENNTGIFVAQPITKKIVTIERDKESIRYEVKKNGS